MIQKKICLLGGFGVGKTSLVAQYVHSMFSEKYLTTVGVKIDKKGVDVDDTRVELVIWDIYGHDDFQKLRLSYLRGASGLLLVADGTRGRTLGTALELQHMAAEALGPVPFVLVLNKSDLQEAWEVRDEAIDQLVRGGWTVMKTSARSGDNVERAFARLARAMLTTPAAGERHE